MDTSPPIPADVRVGRLVRAALAEHGLDSRALEPVLEMTHAPISRRLTGNVPFRVAELIAIGEFLGVDPGRFLTPPSPQKRPAA